MYKHRYFNSIKVRLNQWACTLYVSFVAYFNSIKVRLNRPSELASIGNVEFQFHKGTIKPGGGGSSENPPSGFQFHKGTIKPWTWPSASLIVSLFQFHKGTIKPPLPGFSDLC